MDSHTQLDLSASLTQLESLADEVWTLAKTAEGNSLELLAILRILEQLHQDIRDSLFQQSLPDNRQQLYHLLREIESQGGWPYIPRSSLKSVMEHLQKESPVMGLEEVSGQEEIQG
ncbi:hypothetical protein [Planktothrix mougeotii]|uniref:Uncharacterized protein n=1 Tax=Planktothrix mougeotii LEGE 06226 TaxID=1828728 RepID=A0ABR9U822_9CYAN|nr:hypothetical protein [Planktothrix mougeotii]MBE9142605.1 hypothetical protein [Planktothrix mougeotii LEGE 06226]